jgi:P4 family phage/plasmid primase-like protien
MTFNLSSAVENWFNLGLNVLPTKDKKPLVHSWKEWQTTRQTKVDIEKMPWEYANGFAVICGTETTVSCHNETKKLYLGVIDIDHKDTFDFSHFETTFIERSPHGFHLFYWSECPVDAIKYDGFELLGAGNYVCIYNSPYNNAPINVKFDLTSQFKFTCNELGISNNRNSSLPSNSKANLNELLQQDVAEGQRDNSAIFVASKLRSNGKSKNETLSVMLEYNQNHCHPPLDENIIEQKVESAYKTDRPYYSDSNESKFNRTDFRDEVFHELITKYHFATLPNEEMYIYRDGVYSTKYVKATVKSETERRFGKYYTPYDEQVIIARIKAESFKDVDNFSEKNLPLNYVCVENGIVDLNTGQLIPHNPNVPFLNKLPIKFDPNAKCPLTDEKMHEWLESDGHVQTMYEVIGSCLVRKYVFQYAFFLLGEGENGKTTLIKLLTRLLGSENVSNIPLQDIGDEFKTANLFGKLANIADELSSKALEDTTKFKQITGESPMYAYKKYVQEPIQFINYSKQIYATNALPKISDNSHAFFRRPIIFNFPKAFTLANGKKDPNLLSKLTTDEELSGLLNEAIKGWIRLNQKNAFSVQPSSTETEEQWTKDIVQEFASICLDRVSKDDSLAFTTLYDAFTNFCQNKNNEEKAKDSAVLEPESFALKLKTYIPFEKRRQMVSGVRQYIYYGIKLKDGERVNGKVDSYQ